MERRQCSLTVRQHMDTTSSRAAMQRTNHRNQALSLSTIRALILRVDTKRKDPAVVV